MALIGHVMVPMTIVERLRPLNCLNDIKRMMKHLDKIYSNIHINAEPLLLWSIFIIIISLN